MLTLSAPDQLDQNGRSTGIADLTVGPDGHLAVADGVSAVQQAVLQRLRWWRSEWFLQVTGGVPYLSDIFRRPVTTGIVESVLSEYILQVEDVESIESITASLNGPTRHLTVSAVVKTIDGLTAPVAMSTEV